MPTLFQSDYDALPASRRALRGNTPYMLHMDNSGVSVWESVSVIPDPPARAPEPPDTLKIWEAVRAELAAMQKQHDQEPTPDTGNDLAFWQRKETQYATRAQARGLAGPGAEPSP